MNALILARWQFGITTVYHFLFVPLTIGLAFLTAGLQTAWVRTNKEHYLRSTKFFGKLFLINFGLGVATGIVQEFQFGMAWSEYSRFVGDIFGAPLAIEGLLAFFLESTFLGLWIFGWERLPRKAHVACMWITAAGTVLSGYFILAANAWMQHPVGFLYNAATRQDNLRSYFDVIFNPAVLMGFPHVIAGAFLTAGGLVGGVALWQLTRARTSAADIRAFRSAVRAGAVTVLASFVVVLVTGDLQGKFFTTQYQPKKMAAAEALFHTAQPAPFSLLTIGNLDGTRSVFDITVPRVLSFLATGNWNSRVQGINNLQQHYAQLYGPGNYIPSVPVIYWSFRSMIGAGMLAALIALVALWLVRGDRVPKSRLLRLSAIVLPFLPLLGNSAGWIMTEMGRQPWVVWGQLKTAAGVSPVSAGEVLTSLIVFTLLYGALAVIEAGLMVKTIRAGLPPEGPPPGPPGGPSVPGQRAAEPTLVY